MFLKNVSKTFQNFAYNDGKRQRQIAPGETVALIDAEGGRHCDQNARVARLRRDRGRREAEGREGAGDRRRPHRRGDTEVLTTVHCPGVFKNGNPCNAVVQLAEGERYEDAPRFCGRHKDREPRRLSS